MPGTAMLKPVLPCIAAIAFLALPVLAHSATPPCRDDTVHVEKDGATFVVEANWSVAASADEVWGVLTDFDHMAQILSSVDASRVLNRDGNRFDVVQTSHGNVGPLHISTESVRRVELTPKREIRSQLLKGDVQASDFRTSIVEEGGVSRISVRGQIVAGALAATAIPVELVEAQTRRTYQELRDEILRRNANRKNRGQG